MYTTRITNNSRSGVQLSTLSLRYAQRSGWGRPCLHVQLMGLGIAGTMATATAGGHKVDEEPKDVTSNEEKELRRVYDHLANYYPKSKLQAQLKPRLEQRSKIMAYKKSPESVTLCNEAGDEMTDEEVDAELTRLNHEIRQLQAKIDKIAEDPGRKIHAPDLNEALRHLNKKCTKVGLLPCMLRTRCVLTIGVMSDAQKEIEDMIWEVDENLDGAVDWDEFHLMFQRNIKDKTGLEPFQLFNVVQFMMYDRDNSGNVSVDETMHMLYARYGKERLEQEMKALFGDNLGGNGEGGDGSLSFNDYLKAVNVRVPKPGKGGKKDGHGRRKRK